MEDVNEYYGDKDAQWWKMVASRLAFALAFLLLCGGLIWGWTSMGKQTLESYRNSNKLLKQANSNVTKKLAETNKELGQVKEELKKSKARIRELEEALLKYKTENAILKSTEQ